MAGGDEDVRGRDVQLRLQPGADIGEVGVFDPADFRDGDRIHGDEDGRRGVVPQDQGLDVQRVVRRPGVRPRDVDFGDAGPQLARIATARRAGAGVGLLLAHVVLTSVFPGAGPALSADARRRIDHVVHRCLAHAMRFS